VKNILKSTVFLAIVACFLWSTAFAGVKIGLKYMPPYQFAGLRFQIAGLVLIPVFGNIKVYFHYLKRNIWFVLLVAFLQTFLMYGLFYTGMNLVPGSLGAMVIGSGPVFAALVAHFAMKNDRLNTMTVSSFLVGIVGIVIINIGRHSSSSINWLELTGVFILILNNVVSGAYNVVVMKSKRQIPSLVLSSASLWIGGAALLLFSIPVEGIRIQNYPLEFFISLAWLSFLSAAAFAIWFVLLKRPGVKVSYLNSWKFIIPVLGAALSWLLLPNESPDVYSVVGMLIVGASLLIMNHEAIFLSLKRMNGR
jgi:drug/metabolite transporter (DMT)-like permease